jgi:hypothetical protein
MRNQANIDAMEFARFIAAEVLVVLAFSLVYSVVTIYIANCEVSFRWMKRKPYWTKRLGTLTLDGRSVRRACKRAFATTTRPVTGASWRISAAYRVGLEAAAEALTRAKCSRLRTGALSFAPRTRSLGRLPVPLNAARPEIQLKPTQQRALAALSVPGRHELTRGLYEELTGVSRSQAAYDLAELVEVGILCRVGGGRATRYRLAQQPGQRHWTSDRIRAELEAFCGGSPTWPSPKAFKSAGRGDLYVAASRYGGIGYWAAELGLARRGSEPETKPVSLRGKLAWAGAGALAALGLATAAGAVLVGLTRSTTPVATPASPAAPAVASGRVSDESAHRIHSRADEARPQRATPERAQASGKKHLVRRAPERPASRSTSISYTTAPQSSSTSSSAAARTALAATPTGPTPLRAPSTGSPPAPLKAP